MPKDSGIGASPKRREDIRFLTGLGQYTDDISLTGETHAVFARSQVANGIIKSIDTSAAENMPGVLAVFTGDDFVDVGGNPAGWLINSRDGEPMKEPKRPVLAHGKVRHVGDAYAAVIAETAEQARDAAEAIEADIDEQPAVVDMKSALAGGALVHDEIGTNQCFDWGWIEDNRAVTDAAIKSAPHVTTLELVNNRLVPNAMEPRASTGVFDPGTGDYTLYTTSQNPHLTRLLICAFVLGIPENKLRVVAPDVGGGFGSKIYHYGEEALVLSAAKKLGRPVRWTASRSESFLTDAHGRDHVTKIEIACEKDGTFLAFRTETMANVGAYLSNFSTATPTFLHGTLMAGNYTVPTLYVNVKAVFTNTAPVDAYRGAGRPEATYSLERAIDKCAQELGMDPLALRRKNFIKPDQFPYAAAAGLEYDTGNYHALVDKLEELADLSGFEARRAATKATGKLRGIGVNTYIEACGIAPSNLVGVLGSRVGLYDAATVRVNATGNISVMVGAHSHGQGHETAFPQVVADMLGIDEGLIDIVHGDTSKIPFGMGTYGSRSLAVCGSAVVRATEKIINKAKKIAAHMMEASEQDVEFSEGQFSIAGTDKSVGFGDVALKAYIPHNFPIEDIEPGLEETAFYDPSNFTYPAGAYACEVEVDPDTGKVTIDRFTAVDDFGNVINPMIVTGQVHGGLAQGIGQALLENCTYDENGQILSA
ncbi:MAG: xanthine dehydrogenase family protein, partial [Marinovum sp.]|nr:xanthine dehydrogenase family protein [Marinovum sp.]